MTTSSYKINLSFCSRGSWQQTNHSWEYVTDQPLKKVNVVSTMTHSELLEYACKHCEVANHLGMTTMAYKLVNDDHIYRLENDEHVAAFLEWAAGLRQAPTLIVYDVPKHRNERDGEEEVARITSGDALRSLKLVDV